MGSVVQWGHDTSWPVVPQRVTPGSRRRAKVPTVEVSPLALLLADVAGLTGAQARVCSDLAALSRAPDLPSAVGAELEDLAADLGVLVLLLRELVGRIEAWAPADGADTGA
jgi:hypothetical protein